MLPFGDMVRLRALFLVAQLLPVAAYAKPWKPHRIRVVPGVPLRPDDIKPYVPPKLEPEPELEPSDVKVVEVTPPEATVMIRPWASPMVGNVVRGARIPVRGVVPADGRGCSAKVWYALEPFGYLCAREAKPTTQPVSTESVLRVKEGRRLPFQYVIAVVKEGDKLPMWTTVNDLKSGSEPERQLERGDTVAIEKPFKWEGQSYWISAEGKVMPQKGFVMMGPGSEWHGLTLDDKTPLPFGWITPDQAKAYAEPPAAGEKTPTTDHLPRRARVQILEERTLGKRRWLRVTVVAPPPTPADAKPAVAGPAAALPTPAEPNRPPPEPTGPSERWVSADAVNEVRKLDRPSTVAEGVTQWIDVDLGEQVLVAYENDKPVFATLISSGRSIPTPMGTYPVWAKVSAITMKNQPYEDKGYFVNKVPWSTFFQWHNAIHGAYWHDRFGVSKSHGCVNVAPLDARHIFEWVTPALPAGWTGLRPLELLKSPHVVVRNSHMKNQFRQDRPIGPPDRALENQRLEEAEKRRADEAVQAAAATTPLAPTTSATAAPPAPVAR
jgi:lipoprotein-anchoring transpeptidase ErfK/SrfK